MRHLLLASVFAFAPLSSYTYAAETADQSFAALSEDYWDAQMELSPLYATFAMYPKYHDRLDDTSAFGRARDVERMKKLRERLEKINWQELSEADRVSREIMKLELDRRIEWPSHNLWQWNVDHMDGPQSWIPTVVAVGQPMKTDEDVDALLIRMKQMPAFFASHVSNLREGVKNGRVAAKVPTEKLISQLEGLLAQKPEETPFSEAVKKLPEELKAKRGPDVFAAVETHVFPAYRQYLSYLKDEYLAKTRDGQHIGLSGLPNGAEDYKFMIKWHTTTDLSPEQIHKVGLDEVKSLLEEMRKIAKKMKHKGELKAFLEGVRKDPKNFFATREEVLRTAEDLVAQAKARLPDYFGTLPRTPLVVKPIEEYKEKNDVAARYYQPSDDFSRPGIYFINTYEPQTRPRFSMASLAVHEGVPGHHMQIAIQMEQKDLPTFRRHGDFTAFVEGWALYAERVGDEMGLYKDDLTRVGMLSDQLLRACRLVVDTGLHAYGWPRQRAIDYMKENTPMSEEEIVAEVDRYTIWPGQALAYKIGQREIAKLREDAKKKIGRSFDLKKFHDDVLKNGAVPLPVLRQVVLGEKPAAPRERSPNDP